MVDPERDDLDPFTICTVELHELVDLNRARGEQSIRAAYDLRLGPRPPARFGLSTSSGLASAFTRSRVWNVDTAASRDGA